MCSKRCPGELAIEGLCGVVQDAAVTSHVERYSETSLTTPKGRCREASSKEAENNLVIEVIQNSLEI